MKILQNLTTSSAGTMNKESESFLNSYRNVRNIQKKKESAPAGSKSVCDHTGAPFFFTFRPLLTITIYKEFTIQGP